jgi:hypothetical protein
MAASKEQLSLGDVMATTRRINLDHRARVALIGTLALLVALIATAFAIGGSSESTVTNRASAASGSVDTGLVPASPPSADYGTDSPVVNGGIAEAAVPPALASKQLSAVSGSAGSSTGTSPATHGSATSTASDASDASVEATKIVRTGSLTVRVAKSRVQSVVAQLSTLATAQGGYVSSSNSNLGSGEPFGEVVLRVPVGHFNDAIAAASKLGHVLSLTTSADDVTGHYVDLNAKEHALERTRSSYLSILARATTIGATLAVQERIEDVQQQIDELHGQLKVLSSQASYSRHGLSKAWHTSWSRFGRGIDAMVGAIGPIVFALILLSALALVGLLGYRGVRRITS